MFLIIFSFTKSVVSQNFCADIDIEVLDGVVRGDNKARYFFLSPMAVKSPGTDFSVLNLRLKVYTVI